MRSKVFRKYILILSLLLNILVAWWGKSQVDMTRTIEGIWMQRDESRRESVRVLERLIVDRSTKAELIETLQSLKTEFFEKEGSLVANDLTFSFQGEKISKVESFVYEDKKL